jgi:hypothetical protein
MQPARRRWIRQRLRRTGLKGVWNQAEGTFKVSKPRNDVAIIVAALENGSVEILDIRRGERAAEIKGLKEPQGFYYDFKTGIAEKLRGLIQ